MDRKTKAVIFDLDGTLVDESRAFLHSMGTAVEKLGLPKLPNEYMYKLSKAPPRKFFSILVPESIRNRNEILSHFKRIYGETYYQIHLKYAKLMPNVKETLNLLNEMEFLIGIATRRITLWEAVPSLLKYFDIEVFISAVVTTQEAETKKEQIRLCAKILKVRLDDCFMVGDSPEDIIAGNELGTVTVAFLRGFSSEKELKKQKPNYCIKEIYDILRIIN